MVRPSPARRSPRRPSGGERVFADDDGLLWSATRAAAAGPEGAVVFSCITDSRQPVRAVAVEATIRVAEVPDDMLRSWLRLAPRIGRLT